MPKKHWLVLASSFIVSVGMEKPADALPTSDKTNEITPISVIIKNVRVEGATAFSPSEIAAIVEPYRGQAATFQTLLEIQRKLFELYVKAGYRTTVVILPQDRNQELQDGIVNYEIKEGTLENLEIQGLSHLKPSYVRDRLLPYATTPLNTDKLEEGLLLLRDSPQIERLNSRLIPGNLPGQSIWQVSIEESPPWRVGVEGSNEESPIVGDWGPKVSLAHQNLFGFGDGMRLEYKQTEGLERFLATALVPVNAQEGTLQLSYQLTDSKVIVEEFRRAGIRNEAFTASASFQQPIVRTPTDTLTLGLSVEQRENQSYLLGSIPFSFSPDVTDGFTELTAIRFNQSYRTRRPESIVWVNSQFTYGFSNLNDLPNFFSWQGQVQWLKPFSENIRLLTRLSAQLSGDTLPGLEQCAIGGLNGNQFIFGNTVRGYATNLRSGDNCFAASVELWINLASDPDWGTFNLVPFVDYGTVWDNRGSVIPPNRLASTGLGLRWQVNEIVSLRLDYGIPLQPVNNRDLEEQQWNFSLFFGTRF